MLVMKFGGTSVADADRIKHAADLVRRETRSVVVTSALGGVTDELVALGQIACAREAVRTTALVEALRKRHETAVNAILATHSERPNLVLSHADRDHFSYLDTVLQGVQLDHVWQGDHPDRPKGAMARAPATTGSSMYRRR